MRIPRRDAVYLTAVTTVALLLMLAGSVMLLWESHQGGDPETDLGAVRKAIASGDVNATRAFLDRVISRAPDHVDARLLRAEMRLGVGESEAALADYNHVLSIDPGHTQALLGRALAKVSLADQAGALSDLDAALAVDPANAEALHLRAVVRSSRFENNLALADFDAAVALQPERLGWRLERAALRREVGRFAEAAEDLEFVLSRQPGHPDRWSSLAWCRWGAGDLEKALDAFDKVLELDADMAHAYFGRGAVLMNLGRVSEAVRALDEARARTAQRVEYAALYAWIARARLGDLKEADDTLRADLLNEGFPWRQWPGRLASFLLGEVDEATILDQSREALDGNTAEEQRCEALYYAAWKRHIAGDRAAAADLLRQCAGIPLVYFYEWNSARHDLAALDAAVGIPR